MLGSGLLHHGAKFMRIVLFFHFSEFNEVEVKFPYILTPQQQK
jgi:hypothetical protein